MPPFLATLVGRIAAGIIGMLVLSAAWLAYKESIRSEGREEVREEHAEEVKQQQEAVRTVEQKQYDALLGVVERTAAEKDKFYKQFIQAQHTIKQKDAEMTRLSAYIDATKTQHSDMEVKYVPLESEPSCLVPDELTHRVDELAGVLNAIPYRRLPENERTDTKPAVQGSAPATCAQLLGRIEILTARLGDSLIAHRGLSEYVMEQLEMNRAFQRQYATQRADQP